MECHPEVVSARGPALSLPTADLLQTGVHNIGNYMLEIRRGRRDHHKGALSRWLRVLLRQHPRIKSRDPKSMSFNWIMRTSPNFLKPVACGNPSAGGHCSAAFRHCISTGIWTLVYRIATESFVSKPNDSALALGQAMDGGDTTLKLF